VNTVISRDKRAFRPPSATTFFFAEIHQICIEKLPVFGEQKRPQGLILKSSRGGETN